MNFLKNFIIYLLVLLVISCSNDKKVSIVKEKNIETQMIEAFEEGYKELENGDALFAAKKFNEAELLYPQSKWLQEQHLWLHIPTIRKIIIMMQNMSLIDF